MNHKIDRIRNRIKEIQIYQLSMKYYLPLLLMLVIAVVSGTLEHDAIGIAVFLILAGGFLAYLGENLPVIGKWLSGAILVPMFGGSLMVYFHLLPETLVQDMDSFMSSGIVNVMLSAMIVGAILKLDREVLKKVSVILLPCIGISMIFAILFLFLASVITGTGILDGVFSTGLPNFCGGSPSCLVAIPEIYSDLFGGEPLEYAGQFMVLLVIANLVSVIFASCLNVLGEKKPQLTGNGMLMDLPDKEENGSKQLTGEIKYLEIGGIVSLSMLVAGHLLSKWLPVINYVGWATIIVIVFKILNLEDDKICIGTQSWEKIVNSLLNPAFALGIGICNVNLESIRSIVTFPKLFIIILGITGAVVGAWVAARIFHLYPIDTMIAVGCNYATLGGSGTIAVLTASDRMCLMPFATITCRIGGAMMLILFNVAIKFFIP